VDLTVEGKRLQLEEYIPRIPTTTSSFVLILFYVPLGEMDIMAATVEASMDNKVV
jgi:hypothetical protein